MIRHLEGRNRSIGVTLRRHPPRPRPAAFLGRNGGGHRRPRRRVRVPGPCGCPGCGRPTRPSRRSRGLRRRSGASAGGRGKAWTATTTGSSGAIHKNRFKDGLIQRLETEYDKVRKGWKGWTILETKVNNNEEDEPKSPPKKKSPPKEEQ